MLNRFFYTHVGTKYGIAAVILFCLFFKPISFILKITGIYALMKQIGLLDANGMFRFEIAFIYSILAITIFSVIGMVYVFFSNLSFKRMEKQNKQKGYFGCNL